MADLLIELFSEEIPARMQAKASDDLKRMITDGLVAAGLTYASAVGFATPRRLALSVEGLTGESRALREERRGPAVSAPDQAIDGFLRSTGLTKDQLEVRDDKKGQVYFAVIEKPGRKAAEIIAEVLETTVRTFPWPKSMRWGDGSLRWVRPLHTILCILTDEAGAEVVPVDIDGIAAGNSTRGHRFMAPEVFAVSSFEDYEAKLKRAKVILRPDERAEAIWQEATSQAFAQGLEVVEDAGLLAEVASLVEWPVVLMGRIGEEFLDMPPEVLRTSMKDHQKFFSVKNPKTGRIERFVTVANIETADNGATILAGNQKVLSARLSDAKFFWENDLRVARHHINDWVESLETVTFHNKLGSQYDRVLRIVDLSRDFAAVLNVDSDTAAQAAYVAKADLQSEMVFEFPELQGVIGQYYAKEAGFSAESSAVSLEHYAPLGPSDAVPSAPLSVCVALADKIDTLTAFWAINETPTGSKDPFALRRAALGVIRLVLGNDIRVRLGNLFIEAALGAIQDQRFGNGLILVREIAKNELELEQKQRREEYESLGAYPWAGHEDSWFRPIQFASFSRERWAGGRYRAAATVDQLNVEDGRVDFIGAQEAQFEFLFSSSGELKDNLLSFFHDRLKVFLKDQGIRHDIIDACIAMPGNDDLTLLVKRAKALSETLSTDDGENLLQGFKRANNILTQAEEKDGVAYEFGADVKFAEHDSERALFAALDAADAKIRPAMEAEDFTAAMAAMADLRGPIDAFFTDVQVNADNPIVRRNRLNLLSRIRTICLSVADLTRIEG